jgi:hypothetical protein
LAKVYGDFVFGFVVHEGKVGVNTASQLWR